MRSRVWGCAISTCRQRPGGCGRRSPLPWTSNEPVLDHRKPIATPKRFAIDKNPRRAEHAAGDGLFATLARDGLDFGVGNSRQNHVRAEPKEGGSEAGNRVRIVDIEAILEIAKDDMLCQYRGGMRVASLEVIKGTNGCQADSGMFLR